MEAVKVRDILYMFSAILFSWLYIPHLLAYYLAPRIKENVKADMVEYRRRINVGLCELLTLLYLLHHNRFFRVIFYHRTGAIFALLFGWWRPGDRYFIISKTTKIGKGVFCPHPYSTIINAESIGPLPTGRVGTIKLGSPTRSRLRKYCAEILTAALR